MYYEMVAIWDGELYAHTCATVLEAIEWAKQYSEQKNCAVRVWRVKTAV